MKHILVCIVAIAFAALGSAQVAETNEWNDLLYKKDATFKEIQDKFNAKWQGKEYSKGKGWKQFKRWEAFWENRLMPDGTFPNFSEAFSEYQNFTSQFSNNQPVNGNWLPLGPFDHITTGSWSSGTGRINVAVQDPNDANTIFVGAPAGGVWKSTNAGNTWVPLGDQFSVIGISGIAIDPTDSDVIYVTTGDADAGDTYSIGVWKSTDGGTTWNQAGTDFGQGNKILIDPNNTSTIWVAANTGLYKSTNSGASWNAMQGGNIRDIALKPNDPQTVYATTASECYYTTNGGASFSTATGLPGGTNRLAVTVSPAAPNTAYILAADGSWGFDGIYKSTDSGNSFSVQNNTTDIFDGSTQAWYDMAVTVSDTDPNTLIAGVLNLWRSTDGGVTWTGINSWSNPSGASYTHADIHYLNYFDGNLYCGSDGGVYKSTNNGNTFDDLSDGLQIGQYYTIAGAQSDVSTLCGGLQDNGGYAYTDGSWKCYYGADGMGSAVNNNDPDEIWGMIQYGGLYYTTDGGFNLTGVGSPQSGRWVTPMVHDEDNNRIVAGYDNLHEYIIGSGWNQISTYNFAAQLSIIEVYEGNSDIMYASSGSDLAKTTDGGTSFTAITLPFSGTVSSLEINPNDDSEIWITRSGWTSGQKVYRSTNSGATWSNISVNLPNLPTNIIKYNSTNDGIYIGMDIGVYFFNSVLGSWIPFNQNLPNVIVNDLEINEANNIVRAGTYGRGIWESGVYDAVQLDLDAMLLSVDSPTGTYCGANSDASISIRNIGTVAITSLDIVYDVDGGTSSTFNWTGNLAVGANEVVNLPSITSTDGSHSFNVTLENPNGLADENTDNNSGSSSFNTVLNGEMISFNLTPDCWGGEVGWSLVNELDEILYSQSTGIESNVTTTYDWCLPAGCYDLIITDSYGDGMTGASYGSCGVDGDYNVTDGANNVLVQMATSAYGSGVTESFCVGALVNGCIDPNSCNYDSAATVDDGSCDYSCVGCTDSTACNYDNTATIDSGSCDFSCYGCIDSTACNYDSIATIDDESCDYSCYGCTDPTACNYDSASTIDDGSCVSMLTWYLDSDNDGYGNDDFTQNSCAPISNFVLVGGDCDDVDPLSYPGAPEICDGKDNNCDGNEDEGLTTTTYYEDLDGDGYGSANSIDNCEPVGNFTVELTGDCDDTDENINPDSDEICGNTIDDNCNMEVDENETMHYADLDGDGYGDVDNPIMACSESEGIVANALDCDDTRDDMYPGAEGTMEDMDNDCNGEIEGNEKAPCMGDYSQDGFITITDLVFLLADYGCTSDCTTDLTGDGFVTSADVTMFLGLFGSACN